MGQELFWKPLPSRSHRGKIPTLLGEVVGGSTGEVREGDLDPGHFRRRGEKARGRVWVLTWEVMEEEAVLRGDYRETWTWPGGGREPRA